MLNDEASYLFLFSLLNIIILTLYCVSLYIDYTVMPFRQTTGVTQIHVDNNDSYTYYTCIYLYIPLER